jgi:integral membrane sensor domain MASE1
MLGCTAQYLLFLPLIVWVATRGADPLGTAEGVILFAGMALVLIVPIEALRLACETHGVVYCG